MLPVSKQRLAEPERLVDISRVVGLAGITSGPAAVRIGAMTRHVDVAGNADVARLLPALATLAGGIGDPHVRNHGSIGGSLANDDPAADYPASVLGLDATIHTDRRAIAADDFFQSLFTTALEEGEPIAAVEFPLPRRAGYARHPHPASRFAMVGVFVAETASGVRVAVTGAEPSVFRAGEFETALAANFSVDALAGVICPVGPGLPPITISVVFR